jgi:hypothetical protein
MAALKVHLTAGYATVGRSPGRRRLGPRGSTAREMAGALPCEALTLTSGVPLTLAACRPGAFPGSTCGSLCDETANLEPAAAAALEAHFLGSYFRDPDAPGTSRACLAADVPVPADDGQTTSGMGQPPS